MSQPVVGITHASEEPIGPYVAAIEAAGGTAAVLEMEHPLSVQRVLDSLDGLLLSGGADIGPQRYGETVDSSANLRLNPARDENELPLVKAALERDLPILGICRGMQLINVCFGGTLLQDFPGHRNADLEQDPSIQHQVYVSPGSKLGAIIGAGAFYRTNSLHHPGVKEATRAPALMASSFQPDDGVVEGLESPEHRWLIGVQCHPERETEVAKTFLTIWSWLVGWAERYEAGDME